MLWPRSSFWFGFVKCFCMNMVRKQDGEQLLALEFDQLQLKAGLNWGLASAVSREIQMLRSIRHRPLFLDATPYVSCFLFISVLNSYL